MLLLIVFLVYSDCNLCARLVLDPRVWPMLPSGPPSLPSRKMLDVWWVRLDMAWPASLLCCFQIYVSPLSYTDHFRCGVCRANHFRYDNCPEHVIPCVRLNVRFEGAFDCMALVADVLMMRTCAAGRVIIMVATVVCVGIILR
jgi:hypothetical protein